MTGFTSLKYASRCFVSPNDLEFAGNDPDIERVVHCSEEMMDLVKRQLCAMKVVCFDWGLNLSAQFRVLYQKQFRRSSPLSQALLPPPKHFCHRRKYWMCDIKLYHQALPCIAVGGFQYLRVDHVLKLDRHFSRRRKGETGNAFDRRLALSCGNGQMAGKGRGASELNTT